MTARRNTSAGKGACKKLKLGKETLKDLDAKKKTGAIKGGQRREPWGTETNKCTHDLWCPTIAP